MHRREDMTPWARRGGIGLGLAWLLLACGDVAGPDKDIQDAPEDEVADEAEAATLERRRVRRLSHLEYDRTIQDLLGVEVTGASAFPADAHPDGFRNDSDALVVSPLLVERYRDAAEELALRVLPDVAPLLPCEGLVSDAACGDAFLRSFGRRAFRRPLRTDERDLYLEVLLDIAREEGFETGVRWTIAGILQSPHFLYRPELGREEGGSYQLTDYEIASLLSYLVWQSMPDDALLDAAEAGGLASPDTLDATLDRMLADPRAEGLMSRFTEPWLETDDLLFVFRDPEIYPELTADVREVVAAELELHVNTAFEDDWPLAELLGGSQGWTHPVLAELYGFPDAGSGGFEGADLSATPYTGVLTRPAVQLIHAHPGEGSPVERGLLVRERLLCETLPPPPPGVDATLPVATEGQSTRERLAQHRADPSCAGCHDRIDPIGFGFEGYDAMGRHAEEDAHGEVMGLDGQPTVSFADTAELVALLADSPDVTRCFVRHWVQHGLGLSGASRDALVDPVSEGLADARLQAVVRRVAEVGVGTPRTDLAGAPDTLEPLVSAEPVEDIDDGDSDVPQPAGGVRFERDVQSDWGAGYCTDAYVYNDGTTDVVWSHVEDVGGTLQSAWNAQTEDLGGGSVRFWGMDYNEVVPAGERVSFGYCVER